MDEVVDEIRRLLETRYAPTGTLVPYSDLASQVTSRPIRAEFMDRPLGVISRETAGDTGGAILLSALVVNKDTLQPGVGFFRLARELGVLTFHDHDREEEFWLLQLEAIRRYYGRPGHR
jgi:hypothetical protein